MAPEWELFFQESEQALCRHLQQRILNFYPAAGINPYVPLAAEGPWIVTSHGAVLHDSGGYGMLGLGHAPAPVLSAIADPVVMANVMTPSFSQYRLTQRLASEIGRSRGGCPFGRFVFLNSGSEAIESNRLLAGIVELGTVSEKSRTVILRGFLADWDDKDLADHLSTTTAAVPTGSPRPNPRTEPPPRPWSRRSASSSA